MPLGISQVQVLLGRSVLFVAHLFLDDHAGAPALGQFHRKEVSQAVEVEHVRKTSLLMEESEPS